MDTSKHSALLRAVLVRCNGQLYPGLTNNMRTAVVLLAVFGTTETAAFAQVPLGRTSSLDEPADDNPAYCPKKPPSFGDCVYDSRQTLPCEYGEACCVECKGDSEKAPCVFLRQFTCQLGPRGGYWQLAQPLPVCLDFSSQAEYCASRTTIQDEPRVLPGKLVIDGKTGDPVACITDPAETKVPDGDTIATQCCTLKDECRRYHCEDPTILRQRRECCISGHSFLEGVTPMTYADAEAECSRRGLQLCDQSCKNQGCLYNSHPVWTRTRCEPGA